MKYKIFFVELIYQASICCLIFFLSSNYSLANEYDFIDFSTSGNGTGPSIMRDAKSFIDSHQYYKANKEFSRIIEFSIANYNFNNNYNYNSDKADKADTFLGRSRCNVNIFKCKKAIESYAGEAYLGRGICFIEILQHEKAISELSSSIRLFNKLDQYDKAIWAYYFRGYSYSQILDFTHAFQDLSKAITFLENRYSISEWYNNPVVLKMRVYTLYERGVACYKNSSYKQAIVDFSKVISIGNNFNFSNTDNEKWLYKSLFSRGKCYYQQGKSELALIDIKKAIELNPADRVLLEWMKKVEPKTASSNFNIDESKAISTKMNNDDSNIKKNNNIQKPKSTIYSDGLIKYLSRPFFAKINGKNKLIPNEEALLVDIENKKILFPYKNVSISLEDLKDGEEISSKATYVCEETECRLLIKAISDVEIKHILLFGAPLSPTKVKVIVEPKLRKEFQFESFIPSSIKFEKLDFSIVTKGDRSFEFTLHIEKNKDTAESICNIKAKQSIKNLADEL